MKGLIIWNALYKQKNFRSSRTISNDCRTGEHLLTDQKNVQRLSDVFHNLGNIGMQNKEYAKSVEHINCVAD